MFRKGLIASLGVLSLWAATSFGGLGAPVASAASQPSPAVTAPVLADANRGDCDAIRGTDYWSDEERSWFLSYCVGGSYTTAPAAQPQVVYVYVPVPTTTTAAPAAASSKPVAPSVSISCTTSQGTVVGNDNLQNPSLNAYANEPIYCAANVSGSYTSIDWAAGGANGSGTNFVTNFGYRTLPWTIRVQVNYGGNPIIHNFSITTLNVGNCLYQAGYGIC